jgi:hypothetical protein
MDPEFVPGYGRVPCVFLTDEYISDKTYYLWHTGKMDKTVIKMVMFELPFISALCKTVYALMKYWDLHPGNMHDVLAEIFRVHSHVLTSPQRYLAMFLVVSAFSPYRFCKMTFIVMLARTLKDHFNFPFDTEDYIC